MERIRLAILGVAALALLMLPTGCNREESLLDANNPVTITVWTYYGGVVLNAFDAAVARFNETLGRERGVIVETYSFGGVSDLEAAVTASARREVGSMALPNIFQAFPDTAYLAQQMGLLMNLDNYFSPEEQAAYFSPFIERGRIGLEGELRIFPIAIAAEAMFLNYTDWRPFADAHGLTLTDLRTMEGVARVAQLYYHYSGGRSFYGRDQFANFMIIGSKQFGTEIFEVEGGRATININRQAMRRIWDYYYVPFISGYFAMHGRFRSDDLRVGDILAYAGSTVASVFFPADVRAEGETRPIVGMALPSPLFAGATPTIIQQGAGMVVTLATPAEEYASLLFLKWFTEPEQNILFAGQSAYMPVRTESMDIQRIRAAMAEAGLALPEIADAALSLALQEMQTHVVYATASFTGGVEARAILTHDLQNKAIADRAAVLALVEDGLPRAEAIARFNTDAAFDAWLTQFEARLVAAAGG
ncbi:MAG: extracellular solute-binding protein [Defluviitaleaceae bacterium]|nr:extracellular solute-binding protein [Defluviitaleaceae bacterium]MCL2239719.1 extracellular solute-binding protein [Defluviitaleaceae bacterium]